MLRRDAFDQRREPAQPVSDRELGLAVLILFIVIALTTILVPLVG
jgi:hypothetical protein